MEESFRSLAVDVFAQLPKMKAIKLQNLGNSFSDKW